MTIVQINTTNYGSTGKIALGISKVAQSCGYASVICYPDGSGNRNMKIENSIIIGSKFSRLMHVWASRLTGYNGCFSYFATRKFLKAVKKSDPQIIHLHNLHNCYINIPLLFKFIKKNNVSVVWTLHDCWAFTGQCPHFVIAGCDKWRMGCYSCPQYKKYPQSYIDRTKAMWKKKKKWFTGVKDMTIVTPSNWLSELVGQSYLGNYKRTVINNGIDLSVFKPTESEFRIKYDLRDKMIVLGVAFGWGYSKGIDVFCELAKRLDQKYQVVLVGTDEGVDSQLPDNIISIHRTHAQNELAEIYTAADVFVQSTREENYPTVNMEAIACGTPVVTFKTGGSPEILDESCGSVVNCDDIDAMEREIRRICELHPYSKQNCIDHSMGFDVNMRFEEYVKLYDSIIQGHTSKEC